MSNLRVIVINGKNKKRVLLFIKNETHNLRSGINLANKNMHTLSSLAPLIYVLLINVKQTNITLLIWPVLNLFARGLNLP